jgi:hypothetical protein
MSAAFIVASSIQTRWQFWKRAQAVMQVLAVVAEIQRIVPVMSSLGIAAARQQSSRGCGIFATAKNCPRQELPRHDKRMEYSAVLPITRLDGRQICD